MITSSRRTFFCGVLVCALAGGLGRVAHADTTLNVLAGTEFGRGLGAGLEFGGDHALVLGAGVAFRAGYSSISGYVGTVEPGIGIGYRRYFGPWFVGPSLGLNYTAVASSGALVEEDTFSTSALLDIGHRWRAGDHDLKLGFGFGVRSDPAGDALEPSLGLTLSIGFRL
jgi:hypothetical protein